jgi:hypothetical protein
MSVYDHNEAHLLEAKDVGCLSLIGGGEAGETEGRGQGSTFNEGAVLDSGGEERAGRNLFPKIEAKEW